MSQEEEILYLQRWLDHRLHFAPFIVSVDGLIGKEAKKVLKLLASRSATKEGNMFSNVMAYILYEGASEHINSQSHPCMYYRLQSPDIVNVQNSSTLGGYDRDGPPKISGKRCLRMSGNGLKTYGSIRSKI
jgi:hypothetical protein